MGKKSSPTIPCHLETKKRLKGYGFFGESYDDLLNRLMDEVEGKRLKKLHRERKLKPEETPQ